jgi:hypothetical protein
MAQPKYVAKRFGNDYKIIRSDTEGVVMSGLAIAAGTIIALKGLKRFSLLGLVVAGAGVGLAYYGATGKNPIDELKKQYGGMNPLKDGMGPSHQHDESSDERQEAEDEVDEASMESFPASDPPAMSRTSS